MRRGQYLVVGAGAVVLVAAAITVTTAVNAGSKANTKQAATDAQAACNAIAKFAGGPNVDEMIYTVQSNAAAAAAKDPQYQTLVNDAENYRKQYALGSNVLGADGGKAWARLLSDCQVILGPNN